MIPQVRECLVDTPLFFCCFADEVISGVYAKMLHITNLVEPSTNFLDDDGIRWWSAIFNVLS